MNGLLRRDPSLQPCRETFCAARPSCHPSGYRHPGEKDGMSKTQTLGGHACWSSNSDIGAAVLLGWCWVSALGGPCLPCVSEADSARVRETEEGIRCGLGQSKDESHGQDPESDGRKSEAFALLPSLWTSALPVRSQPDPSRQGGHLTPRSQYGKAGYARGGLGFRDSSFAAGSVPWVHLCSCGPEVKSARGPEEPGLLLTFNQNTVARLFQGGLASS